MGGSAHFGRSAEISNAQPTHTVVAVLRDLRVLR